MSRGKKNAEPDMMMLTVEDYRKVQDATSRTFLVLPDVLEAVLAPGSDGVNRELHSAMGSLLRVRHPIDPHVIKQWIARLEGARGNAVSSDDIAPEALKLLDTALGELKACHKLLGWHYKATDNPDHRFMRLYDATYGMRTAILLSGIRRGVVELEEARARAKQRHKLRFGVPCQADLY